MHKNELWQKFSASGEPLTGEGYPAKLDNPPLSADGPFIGVCCVWLYRHNSNGEIEVLFQKRSKFVDRNPEKWDCSAGGHINLGETPVDAAVRETAEEIGASLDHERLQLIYSNMSTLRVNRLRYIFCYNWDGKEDNFHFDDHEVSEVKWVPLSDFYEFTKQFAKIPLKEDHIAQELTKSFLERRGNL